MDLIEALRTRRSTKSFSTAPVPAQMLSDLVDTASYSPSGANKNPWRFVLITERSTEAIGGLAQVVLGQAIVLDQQVGQGCGPFLEIRETRVIVCG